MKEKEKANQGKERVGFSLTNSPFFLDLKPKRIKADPWKTRTRLSTGRKRGGF